MKRRVFLVSAAAAFGVVIGWRLSSSRQQAAIAKVLYKRLDYLKLDEAGVRRFADDLSSHKVISSLRLRILDAAGELYTGTTPSPGGRIDRALRHGEDRIVTQYLISSDFFTHGADKSRTVNYFGYYDPLVACNNPFARPVTVVPGS
jgi:hypothetical protein